MSLLLQELDKIKTECLNKNVQFPMLNAHLLKVAGKKLNIDYWTLKILFYSLLRSISTKTNCPVQGWGSLKQLNGSTKPGGRFNRPPAGFRLQEVVDSTKAVSGADLFPGKEAEHRINNFIRVPQVRLVGDNVEVGIYDTPVALKMAQEQGLDLVEISPTVDPACLQDHRL